MIRWLSLIIALGCLTCHGAAGGDSPNFYLLEYVADVNWQQGLDFDDQLGSREHQAYLEKLYVNNILMMSGPLENNPIDNRIGDTIGNTADNNSAKMVLISATSPEQARVYAQADPLHQARVVQVKVRGWRVSRSSMISGKLRLTVDDEIAPYILKRINPEAAINIDINGDKE